MRAGPDVALEGSADVARADEAEGAERRVHDDVAHAGRASPFQAICTKFGLLKMNSMVIVLETRSHAPRLCDVADIGVLPRKTMVVHGAICRKWTGMAAMLAVHGRRPVRALRDCGGIAVNQGFSVVGGNATTAA